MMDISSLYTNIDHNEGADSCYRALQKRSLKKVSSAILKKLILLVLQSNIFRFNEQLYRKIKGTAMGTPMAVNYANIFLDDFENKMLDEFYEINKMRPLVWWRYIDDIFFIWHGDETSLRKFIHFCDTYSESKHMKSNIKFESNILNESVNFLDVRVSLSNGYIKTSVYSKPTDAHLYLNKKSCHPTHVIKNIPKGQFIRIRRICSDMEDFLFHSDIMKKHFKLRGYNEIDLTRTISEVQKMKREELLKDKSREINGRGRVFVCTWHPSLKTIPATLSRNHDILLNDPKLKSIFEEKSSVAYRRRKNIGNFLCKNDVRMLEKKEPAKCKGCKLCKIINNEDIVINKNNGAQVRTKKGGHCQSTGVIYAVTCIKCQQIYVGHTGETMAKRWSKHKYDIRNRPDQNELATHCHHNHDIEKE